MVIVLAKNLTFVGSASQSWATDWVAVPAEYQNWQLTVVPKSFITGANLAFQLETTWDTDSVVNVSGGSGSISSLTPSVGAITGGVGPMVRLLLTATGASQVCFSVFLTPKSE